MTIDQLNKEMANEINRLPEGEMGEVVFDDNFFVDIPESEEFLEPPDDVIMNVPENPDEDWINSLRKTCPRLLGIYIPMQSPGQVILFGKNLQFLLVAGSCHPPPRAVHDQAGLECGVVAGADEDPRA